MKSVSSDIYTTRLPEYSSESDDTMFKWKSPKPINISGTVMHKILKVIKVQRILWRHPDS